MIVQLKIRVKLSRRAETTVQVKGHSFNLAHTASDVNLLSVLSSTPSVETGEAENWFPAEM